MAISDSTSNPLFSVLPYFSVPIMYTLAFIGLHFFDNYFFVLWILFTLIPLLDHFLPFDTLNPTEEESKKLEKSIKFKIPLYLSIIVDWAMFFYINHYLQTKLHLGYGFILGVIFLLGSMGGGNINTAHELMHKNNKLDQFLGLTTLIKSLYMHFYIEHVWGHHKNVATPLDPATSKFNQSLFNFLPRSIIGSYVHAWKIENNRLLKIKKEGSAFSLSNRMIWFTLSLFSFPYLMFKMYGTLGLVVTVLQGVIGFVFLEVINYVEHYGLQRKELSPGVYEKVNIRHSWNAPHRISNYLLFKLERHSDHHENACKPYQTLCSYEESPILPHGYTVCLLIAMIPPLWKSIMNNITMKYNMTKQISKEDFHTAYRKCVYFIYGVAFFNTFLLVISVM